MATEAGLFSVVEGPAGGVRRKAIVMAFCLFSMAAAYGLFELPAAPGFGLGGLLVVVALELSPAGFGLRGFGVVAGVDDELCPPPAYPTTASWLQEKDCITGDAGVLWHDFPFPASCAAALPPLVPAASSSKSSSSEILKLQ